MVFEAFDRDGCLLASDEIYSVGGGKIEVKDRPPVKPNDVYVISSFAGVKYHCRNKNIRISDYVFQTEGEEIKKYLAQVWQAMKEAIQRGLEAEGVLAGGLGVQRKAKYLYGQHHIDESQTTRENRLVCSYAFAVSEENAGGGIIVTAPTWAPQAGSLIIDQLDKMKEMTVVNDLVTIQSSLNECSMQEFGGLADTIIESMKL